MAKKIMTHFTELRFDDELPVGAHSEVASLSAVLEAAAACQQARSSVDQQLFDCPLCTAQFANKYSVSRHVKTHHIDDREFDCRVCSEQFECHATFVRHLKSHAAVIPRPHACTLCSKSYLTSSDLAKHRAAKHQTVRPTWRNPPPAAPYVCDYCGRTFSVSTNLAVHERQHTEEKPYACSRCPYRSANATNLKSHEILHHTAGRRPFACDQCGKAFASQCGLLKHRDTHAAASRHACRLCGRRYRHRPTLSRHLRLAHSAAPVLDESMLDLHDLNLNIGTEAAQRIAGEILSCIQDDSSLPPPGGLSAVSASAAAANLLGSDRSRRGSGTSETVNAL